MGALQGAVFVAAVLLLTEIATVASIPQHQVDNRIVNQPQGSLLVPNRHSQGSNVGPSLQEFQSQHFPGSIPAGASSRPDELSTAQGQQNTRIPQGQAHQNLPESNRPRPPQQDSFFPQGATSTPSHSQPNAGRPQSSSAQGFESNVAPDRREKHSSCGKFPSPGQCQAAFPRYYYNASMSQCECYLFGGCDEAEGSYKTLGECHEKCFPARREEGPSCRHVYIENFHTSQPTHPPANSFPGSSSAAPGPSSRPFGNNGQNQPSEGGRPVSNSPENARPQGNRNPNGGSGFQGLPNFNDRSPNFGNGSPNMNTGTPNINTGSPNFSNGSPNRNTGMPNINTGSPNFSNGSPNINHGSPNLNSGSPNFSNGSPNINTGTPNINIGSPNFSTGPPNFNNGSPNLNSGSPNFGNGPRDTNTGTSNFNPGSPNFNTSSPNINNGGPNSNNGSPNFINGSPSVNDGQRQRLPTSPNGSPVLNQPSRDSQAFMPHPVISSPTFQRSPGNPLPHINPILFSENVRFPALDPTLGVMPFVQPPPLFSRNSGRPQTF